MIESKARRVLGEVPQGLVGYRMLVGENSDQVICVAVYPHGRCIFASGTSGPVFDSINHLQIGAGGWTVDYASAKGERRGFSVDPCWSGEPE